MIQIYDIIQYPVLFSIHYEEYRKQIQENDYYFLEQMILQNNLNIVSIILEKEKDVSILFKPGFKREKQNNRRMISFYLFFLITEKMKKLLLNNPIIKNTYIDYYNENLNLC